MKGSDGSPKRRTAIAAKRLAQSFLISKPRPAALGGLLNVEAGRRETNGFINPIIIECNFFRIPES